MNIMKLNSNTAYGCFPIEMVKTITANAPLAVELVKTSANRHTGGKEMTYGTDRRFLFGTEDVKEGMDSFLNKRKPNFKGR